VNLYLSAQGGDLIMGRPVYPYELNDPDFSWLIDYFNENHEGYSVVMSNGLPVVFVSSHDQKTETKENECIPGHLSEDRDDFSDSSKEPAK